MSDLTWRERWALDILTQTDIGVRVTMDSRDQRRALRSLCAKGLAEAQKDDRGEHFAATFLGRRLALLNPDMVTP